jgi:hypothetical protein
LIVVSAVHRGSVDSAVWKRFEDIVVEPLLKGHILASELHNFLSDESTHECAHRCD